MKIQKQSDCEKVLLKVTLLNLNLTDYRVFIAWFTDSIEFSACPSILKERTGIDESNIRKSFTRLCSIGLLLKGNLVRRRGERGDFGKEFREYFLSPTWEQCEPRFKTSRSLETEDSSEPSENGNIRVSTDLDIRVSGDLDNHKTSRSLETPIPAKKLNLLSTCYVQSVESEFFNEERASESGKEHGDLVRQADTFLGGQKQASNQSNPGQPIELPPQEHNATVTRSPSPKVMSNPKAPTWQPGDDDVDYLMSLLNEE